MSSDPTVDPNNEPARNDSAQPTTNPLLIAALASGAAGVVHAAAVGAHGEHQRLATIFAVLAVAQLGAAVAGFVSSGRNARLGLIAVNLAAVLGWLYTRVAGVSFIPGLESRETPGLSDTVAAALALFAIIAAVGATRSSTQSSATRRAITAIAAIAVTIIMIPGLVAAGNHQHDDSASTPGDSSHTHDHTETTVSGSGAATADVSETDAAHTHDDQQDHQHDAQHEEGTASSTESATATESTANQWPRQWDPSQPIDFSGVAGVSAEEQARAEQLVRESLTELPAFSDVSTVKGLGYFSIGDSSTGYEHYVNASLINDDKFLDPSAPESLVYEVDGDQRTLVSAMFISPATTLDDPKLTGYAGPLMQWHIHDNLCWGLGPDGKPGVLAVLDTEGETCPPNTVNPGGGNPMVHVWIAPHACGPFAALEGTGAGQAAVSEAERTDMCSHDHSQMNESSATSEHQAHASSDMGTMDMSATATTGTYDPSLPIDLSGVEGVTPQQQAFAENLVSATLVVLPQWSDLKVVEAAGFKSIGDGVTGHEHYIQWDWINDDVVLDPNHPESLVFEPQPDGSKKLVSAMYMLPGGTPLEAVPDWGGALMQWHVHGDLCFTNDPVAPQVAGTKPIGGKCQPPRVDGVLAPMIHVWITPQKCGPFAALDGIGGGQVPDGEDVSCLSTHQH